MALQSAVTPDTVQNVQVAASNQNQKADRGLQREALAQDSSEKAKYREHQMTMQSSEQQFAAEQMAAQQQFADQQRQFEQSFMMRMKDADIRRDMAIRAAEAKTLAEIVGVAAETDREVDAAAIEQATAEKQATAAAMMANQLTQLSGPLRAQLADDVAAMTAGYRTNLSNIGTAALEVFGIVNATDAPQYSLDAVTPVNALEEGVKDVIGEGIISDVAGAVGDTALGRMYQRNLMRVVRKTGEQLGYDAKDAIPVQDTTEVLARRMGSTYEQVLDQVVGKLVEGDPGASPAAAAAAAKEAVQVAQEYALMTANNFGGTQATPEVQAAMAERLKKAMDTAEMNGIEPAELLEVVKSVELGFQGTLKTRRDNQAMGNKAAPEVSQLEQQASKMAAAITSAFRSAAPGVEHWDRDTLATFSKALSLLGDNTSSQEMDALLQPLVASQGQAGRAFRSSNVGSSYERLKSNTSQLTGARLQKDTYEQKGVQAQGAGKRAASQGARREAEVRAKGAQRMASDPALNGLYGYDEE
jgi:hypothetical protein